MTPGQQGQGELERGGPEQAEHLLSATVAPRQNGPLAPQDECDGLAGARDFRRVLAAAVVARDVEGVVRLADANVRLGFGGADGVKRLRRELGAAGSTLFAELAEVLALGCAKGPGDGLTMPWYFAQDSRVDDPFAALLVTAEDVPVLARPHPNARVIARLSWVFVALDAGGGPVGQYRKVRLSDGAIGYIATAATRNLLDYRLLAARQNGQWRISALVAGD